MKFKFENILICLDLTEMDDSLIRYANYIVKQFDPKVITFIHIMDAYEIPEELADSFDGNHRPLDEMIREEIEDRIKANYEKNQNPDPQIVLESGLTTEKIVGFARNNAVDLTIMGKKIGFEGKGGVTKNIIGLIPSSVLLISETTQHKFEKILIRTNFAKPSVVAYNMARELSAVTGAKLEFHNVYKLPFHYFPEQTPQAILKLRKQLQPFMKKEFTRFLKKYKLPDDIPFSYSVDIKGNEAQSLYNYAIRNSIDLVVTGTRLKSELANVIMDSTSEKLASVEKNIPVMVVKDISHSIGFLKALFE
ncbi:MAG: universal stress protein [Bacteroidales bacterium]